MGKIRAGDGGISKKILEALGVFELDKNRFPKRLFQKISITTDVNTNMITIEATELLKGGGIIEYKLTTPDDSSFKFEDLFATEEDSGI